MGRLLPGLIVTLALIVYFVSERASNPSVYGPNEVVRFWAFSYPAQTMLKLKSEFEQLHPDITVEVQTVPWFSLQQKTLWAVAARSNVPDVIVGSSAWMGGLASNGALMPLDGVLDEDFLKGIHPAALKIYQFPDSRPEIVDGAEVRPIRQYGIPLDLDLPLLFYRKDLVDPILQDLKKTEFPSDWEGMMEVGRAFAGRRNSAGQPLHFMALDPEDPVPFQMAVLPSSGGSLLSENLEQAAFHNLAGVKAFGLYRRLLTEGHSLRWSRATEGDPMMAYKVDRAAVTINGPWLAKYLQGKFPEQSGRWRVTFFPTREPGLPVAGLGGACVAVPYNAPNPEAAVKLIRFMTSKSFALAYFRQVGSLPPRRELWTDPVFDQPEPYLGGQVLQSVVREAIDRSVALQLLPDSEILRGPVRRALSRSSNTDLPIEDLVEQAAIETNRLLSQP
jgi:multiple sugar transport system substrate-binding protein